MFIEHALVRGEYSSKGDFQAKNRALFETLGRLRGKARKSDMLADADALLTFFDLRVAKSVVNGKTFEEWREQAEKQQPQLLELAMSDVLSADEQLVPEHYPDELTIAGARLDLRYRFEPREDNDGVTLVVPLALAARLTPNDLDWTIPAWHERRICELLERLPKAQRRRLGDLSELSARVAPLLKPFAEPFLPSLVRAIEEATAERLPQDNFRTDTLPGYLRLTCCIVDEKGKVLEQSRELEPLLRKYGARARVAIAEHHPAPVQHKQLTQWNFGELKAVATRHVLGVAVHVYPALVDHGDSVELTFKDSEAAALLASAAGVRRLLALALAKPLSQLAKRVPAPFARRAGLPPSQGAKALFCAEVLSRVVKEAFPIDDPRALPRDARAFDALLMGGALQLETAAAAVFAAVHAASAELELTLRALDQASKQAAAAGAIREMQQQLNLLHAEGLVADEELAQLCHIPRYHRAIRVRLERALNDPRKDAAKAEPLLPLWQAFLAKRSAARDQASARALRWAFEELRVAIFAPELKPAYSVRVASLAQAVSALE
jgi:ATP-dependent helicase HrpA